MAHRKTATLRWTGDDWNFETTLGSGYTVQFKAPNADTAGGSPMEFMLAGVAGCTGVDVVSILKKMRQDVQDLTDFRGYLLRNLCLSAAIRENSRPIVKSSKIVD